MSTDGRWLSIGKAAKYLGVSRDTLRRWEKRGKIKSVRSPSNRRYYTQNQLDQIIAEPAAPPNGKPTAVKQHTNLLIYLSWGALGLAVTLLLYLLSTVFLL